MELKLTEEQQSLWDAEYTKHGVMARLIGDYDFYQEISFDAYAAYEYLNRICKLNQEDTWWTINNEERILLHVDEYQNSSKQDLVLRKEYIKRRMKSPGMHRSMKVLQGLKHLAKVIGYDPYYSDMDSLTNGGINVIGEFPLDQYRSLFILKMNAQVSMEEYF